MEKNAKNATFFYKEWKRTQERCVLLKRTDAQPCMYSTVCTLYSIIGTESQYVLHWWCWQPYSLDLEETPAEHLHMRRKLQPEDKTFNMLTLLTMYLYCKVKKLRKKFQTCF